jgi:hypothetical protein
MTNQKGTVGASAAVDRRIGLQVVVDMPVAVRIAIRAVS